VGKLKVVCGQAEVSKKSGSSSTSLGKIALILVVLVAAPQLGARGKDSVQYGMGLIVNVPFPESEVVQVVQDVVQNGIIRGTKEYNKDEYVEGAAGVNSTRAFKAWTEGGRVFYKVRLKAIDPRNFKDGSDVGTLAVRYVVQPQGDKNTVLHIDAVFVEDYRKVSHASNGSVESAEYKDIHDRLDEIATMKSQTVEAEKEKQEQLARKQNPTAAIEPNSSSSSSAPLPTPVTVTITPSSGGTAQAPPQSLEEHIHELRQQVQRLVKAPGAALRSAPFHTATTLQSLPTGTEILIVVSTPYWLGVETHEGQHGWILRDELELVP
jgi:hypothetical protein